jgi:hypothetical protein
MLADSGDYPIDAAPQQILEQSICNMFKLWRTYIAKVSTARRRR